MGLVCEAVENSDKGNVICIRWTVGVGFYCFSFRSVEVVYSYPLRLRKGIMVNESEEYVWIPYWEYPASCILFFAVSCRFSHP